MTRPTRSPASPVQQGHHHDASVHRDPLARRQNASGSATTADRKAGEAKRQRDRQSSRINPPTGTW